MDELNTLIDVQEPVVEVQQNEIETSEVTGAEETNPVEEVAKPQQSHEDNAIAKQARLQAETEFKTRNDEFAQSLGFETFDEMQDQARQQKLEQEAAQKGISVEEIQEQQKQQSEIQFLKGTVEFYEKKEIERKMNDDLLKIQAIDPKVKNLSDLGEDYFKCIGVGVDAVIAYHSIKQSKQKDVNPSMGDINTRTFDTNQNKIANMSELDFKNYMKKVERGEAKV